MERGQGGMDFLAEPRDIAELTEIDPELPPGPGERFSGYGVMGLPFESGHVLALRRFAASSPGPGYASVWHRTPSGRWTFWSDVPPESSCCRFFGRAVDYVAVAPIRIHWSGPRNFRVIVGDGILDWSVALRASPATVLMTALSAALPERAWQSPAALRAMGRIASPLFDLGRVTLAGQAPNGQQFRAAPRLVWLISQSEATLAGVPFGSPRPLEEQTWLGAFAIPQRGLFVIGSAVFEEFDPGRHVAATTRQTAAPAA
jgi:hypothetical protein